MLMTLQPGRGRTHWESTMGEEENEKRAGGDAISSPSAKDKVHAMLGSQLRTTLSDGRVVEGKFQCMDRLTNFILADAVETGTVAGNGEGEGDAPRRLTESGVQQRHLGLVMIPGKHLVSVQRLVNGPRIDA